MSTATARVRLAYEDRGTGTPVVLLHGLTFDRTTWTPIVEKLGNDIRTVAIDLPGHGETAGSPCSLWDAAALVNDTVTALGIERPIIVGHSISGAIASIYGASYPTLGIVNVDQPFEIRPFARMVQSLWPALCGPSFAAAFEPIQQSIGLDRVPEPLRSQVLAIQDIRQDLVLGYWRELMRTDPDDMQARIDDTASHIACPYLAAFGRPLAPSEREDLVNRLAGVEIEEWPDSGHFVHLVEGDRFTRRLRAFTESCTQIAA
ncbi:MAG: alpha/beta hydrolase [Actinomycetota bacterium]|nr:alpha/beta hydrolase [Actinomycetota bacterium]